MSTQRQHQIIEYLKQTKIARITDLANLCNVSQVTMRKDLEQLDQIGLINKYHGEVSLAEATVVPYLFRSDINKDAKTRIARVAVSMITSGESIILDSGSTTTFIARELVSHPITTIVTNSVTVANELGPTDHQISICGGELFNQTLSLVGYEADSFFERIRASKLFLATTGIRDDLSLATENMREIKVKQAMIASAKEVILVADSSKFDIIGAFQFAIADDIDCIITTRPGPNEKTLEIIKAHNINLIFAD